MQKMPARWEPVVAIVQARDAEQLHEDGRNCARIGGLLDAGRIKSFSTPAALSTSPSQMERNREKLRSIDFAAARESLETAIASEGFTREAFGSGFKLLDDLAKVPNPSAPLPDWRTMLRQSSSWWFLVDRYFAHDPLLSCGFVTPNEPLTTRAQKDALSRELPVEGVSAILSGWSFTLTDLIPWSHRQLMVISALMAIFDAILLALLYRDWRLWAIQIATLALAVAAMVATMKIAQLPLNLLNVLAFRLVLAIGVDYGIYVLLVWQKARDVRHDVANVVKPVLLAGLTAICGFGSLVLARNPTLSGLGSRAPSAFSGAWPLRCSLPCPLRSRWSQRSCE